MTGSTAERAGNRLPLCRSIRDTEKGWLTLEEIDGKLVEPTAKNECRICRDYPLPKAAGSPGASVD
jgi:hypothetical protein